MGSLIKDMRLGRVVSRRLRWLSKLFPAGTRLTFIARCPEGKHDDFVLSSDSLSEARSTLDRAMKRAKMRVEHRPDQGGNLG